MNSSPFVAFYPHSTIETYGKGATQQFKVLYMIAMGAKKSIFQSKFYHADLLYSCDILILGDNMAISIQPYSCQLHTDFQQNFIIHQTNLDQVSVSSFYFSPVKNCVGGRKIRCPTVGAKNFATFSHRVESQTVCSFFI